MPLKPGEEPFMVHRSGLHRLTLASANRAETRAAFLDAVVRHVDMTRVSFMKRCVGVAQASDSSKLVLRFADGTNTIADVVIGADGVKSAVRGSVTGADSSKAMTYSHCSCYRGLAPIEAVKAAGVEADLARRPHCFVGPGKVSAITANDDWSRYDGDP